MENPAPQILKILILLLDKVEGAKKKFTFYWKEVRYIVEIRKFKEKRSIDQNSILWMWLTYLSNQTGHSKDDLYCFFEAKFQPWEQKELSGFGGFYTPKPVKLLNTADFNDYLKKLRMDIQDKTGYWPPLPDEPEWPLFYESYKDK